jgi:hypothetical protein
VTGIGADTFSVRWVGTVQPPTSGNYTFYTESDDGVRLWVDGRLIVDNWTDHSRTENAGTIAPGRRPRWVSSSAVVGRLLDPSCPGSSG